VVGARWACQTRRQVSRPEGLRASRPATRRSPNHTYNISTGGVLRKGKSTGRST